MKRIALGFFIAVALALAFWFFYQAKQEREEIRENTALIQKQIKQVGKLIVTEGYYSKVFTFKNSQNLFLNFWKSDKKALVVVNAKATVEYDLRQLEVEIDEAEKTLILKKIPDAVLNIYPEIEYYDVTQDYFNSFEAKDYNKIKSTVSDRIREQIEASDLMEDSRKRLMVELTNLFVLTNSMGWTLMYQDEIIEEEQQLELLKK